MIAQIDPRIIQQIDPILSALSSGSSSFLRLSVENLDESIRRNLDALRDWYFDGLIVATVGVLVGVILEEADSWISWLRLEGITEYRWAKKLMRIGWILIVLGVAGEGIFEVLVSKADALSQHFDEILLADAKNKAEELRKEAEDEHSARVKIEAKVAWRRLSKEQQSTIASDLGNFSGTKVGVTYLGGNAEAEQFSEDITAALRKARWNVYVLEPFSLYGGFGGGVYDLRPLLGVNVSPIKGKSNTARAALLTALCSTGFDGTATEKPPEVHDQPPIDVEVLVVGRPTTQQGMSKLTINPKTNACSAVE